MSSAILTIDDITSKNTPAIVDYLCEKNIKAILFGVGENIVRYYEEAIYALKKGMIVGNHSYTHPSFSELSLEACIEEIEKSEKLIDRLYKDAGVERKYRPFRFPYGNKGGDYKKELQQYFRKHGFHKLIDSQIAETWYADNALGEDIDTFWTFDFGEYQMREGSDFTWESVKNRIHDDHPENGSPLLKEGSHHIILLHAHDETEKFLPDYYKVFIDYVLERGVVFEEPQFLY